MEIGAAIKHFFTKERSQPRIDAAKPPPSEYIKDTPYSKITDKDHYLFACNASLYTIHLKKIKYAFLLKKVL